MNTSRREKEPMDPKYKRYWIIGIVCAIVVVVLLFWNSGILTKNATAATVGDQKFNIAEVSYYYQAVANNTINTAQQYAQLGIDMGYDPELPATEQFYNEEENKTYADYFMEGALDNLKDITTLCSEAKAAGYTLTEKGQEIIDANFNALQMYSLQSGYSEDAYLKLLYGKYMDKSLFKELITNAALASDYADAKAKEFTFTDEELNTYYNENKDALDSFSYRYCYINMETEEKTDADGNPIEPTEEETAAAMSAASQKANSLVSDVRSGKAFNEAAAAYLPEESADPYRNDPEYNHVVNSLGSSITDSFSAWLKDANRAVGEITSIEVPNVGYCVVQFLGRDKGETLYQTMNYRSLPIIAEVTPQEDGTDAAYPTEEQLAAAKEQADALLAEWQSGEATAESFAALVTENCADKTLAANGGLVEEADRDAVSSYVSEWLFAEGRQPGDAAVVTLTDDTGSAIGYEIVYADSMGEIRWRHEALTALRSAAYDEWFASIEENYPAKLTEKADIIPTLK